MGTSCGRGMSSSASGLPSGLSINSSTGVISGTITAGGSWQPMVTAENGFFSKKTNPSVGQTWFQAWFAGPPRQPNKRDKSDL